MIKKDYMIKNKFVFCIMLSIAVITGCGQSVTNYSFNTKSVFPEPLEFEEGVQLRGAKFIGDWVYDDDGKLKNFIEDVSSGFIIKSDISDFGKKSSTWLPKNGWTDIESHFASNFSYRNSNGLPFDDKGHNAEPDSYLIYKPEGVFKKYKENNMDYWYHSGKAIKIDESQWIKKADGFEIYFDGTNIELWGKKYPDLGNAQIKLYKETTKGVFSEINLNELNFENTINLSSPVETKSQILLKIKALRALVNGNLYKLKITLPNNYKLDKALIYPSIEYRTDLFKSVYKAIRNAHGGIVEITPDGDISKSFKENLFNNKTGSDYISTISFDQIGSEVKNRITIEATSEKPIGSLGANINLLRFSSVPSFSLINSFRGDELAVVYMSAPDAGKFDIYVDKKYKKTVDAYSEENNFYTALVTGIKILRKIWSYLKIINSGKKLINFKLTFI